MTRGATHSMLVPRLPDTLGLAVGMALLLIGGVLPLSLLLLLNVKLSNNNADSHDRRWPPRELCNAYDKLNSEPRLIEPSKRTHGNDALPLKAIE